MDFSVEAKRLHDAFQRDYWNEDFYLQKKHGNDPEALIYWWHAHAIDVLVDAWLRGDAHALDRVPVVLDTLQRKNSHTLLNPYYDDMEWMALALLRVYDCTRQMEYAAMARLLWKDIQTAWNGHCGGGMAWRKQQLDYKNTPANAPAAILAARLYQRFRDPDDLAWASKIFWWNLGQLMDPETGFVWDGMNRQGDGGIDKEWVFTYNEGVFLGAAVELHRCTGNPQYLAIANRTARAAEAVFSTPHAGILPMEGDGDCGLFKGIFLRYLYELFLDDRDQRWIPELLKRNAETLLTRGTTEDGRIGGDWTQLPEGDIELSSTLSGLMLVELAARCE